MICRDDFSFKDLDTVRRGDLCKLAQQNRTETASLKIVRDGKCNLGPFPVNNNIECVAHDAFVVTTACDQSERFFEIRLAMSFRRQRSTILLTVESQPTRFFGERRQ